MLLPLFSLALAISATTADTAGAHGSHDAAEIADLEAFIAKQMVAGGVPGLSVAVVSNSTLLYANGFGFSDPQHKTRKVTNATLFTLASISKTIISFVAMRLFDKGLMALDADVNNYLAPASSPLHPLRNNHFPAANITMRQLLSHTSSINDAQYDTDAVYNDIVVQGDSPTSIGAFLGALMVPGGKYWSAKKAFHEYRPGARFDYSNVGATTAAHVCECIAATLSAPARATLGLGPRLPSGGGTPDTFDDLARAMFKAEWGIAAGVGYHVADLAGEDVAVPSKGDRSTPRQFTDYCLYGYPDYPDGSWRTSPTSYSALFRTFVARGTAPPELGGKQVLARSTALLMRNVSAGAGHDPGQAGLPQAIIWYYDSSLGKSLLGHNGGDAGISTDAFFHTKTGVGFIAFTNGDDVHDDLKGKYDKATLAIELRLMQTFDKAGGWPKVADTDYGALAPSAARRGRHLARSARRVGKKLPCGLSDDDDKD